MNRIKVIDIFAGPGGLGEGFSSLLDAEGNQIYNLSLSIEKDSFAHSTLLLRSFYRQFHKDQVPKEYYDFIQGNTKYSNTDLFNSYPKQAKEAQMEAWLAELGKTPNEEIDKRIKSALKGAENWLLIGGPPCQAYSLVGRSRRQETGLDPAKDERVFLYKEYLRILAKHRPPVFVMENVKGLLSAEVEKSPLFQRILDDLRDPGFAVHGEYYSKSSYSKNGYKIFSLVRPPIKTNQDGTPDFLHGDFVIKAEEYGVPQTRHRVILLGIRNDIEFVPKLLKPQNHISVKTAISDLPRLRSGLSKHEDTWENWISALSAINLKGNFRKSDQDVKELIVQTIKKLTKPQKGRGAPFIKGEWKSKYLPDWFNDVNVRGVLNHETRGHMETDLHRYLFCACFAEIYERSPKLSEFPIDLLPDHQNVSDGVKTNHFGDRFRVQLAGQPSKTITSHISKDGHYYVHYDPTQCRSLTVREAARIQTFPDNYFFCGNRTTQYHQVGNAVPPLLARQIAEVVCEIFT